MSLKSFILVDDTSPSIQYSGPWFEVENTQINTGTFGPPFQNTLHGVNVTANFSFPFNGSAVIVYGTTITTNASGTQDPTWECFIDNISIGWSTAPSSSENNWIICDNILLQDGPHVLTVNANVSNQQTFWFDQIQCTSASDETFLRIDSSNPEIRYSSGWQSLVQLLNTSYTQITGAALTYQFTGTSISWVGYTQPLSDGTPTSSTYSIDDQTPIGFPIPASPDNNTYFNQILFKTEQLSPGEHTLVVTYSGNSTSAPLSLNYFVQEGANSTSPNPSSITPTSTSVLSSSSSPSSTSNVGSSSSLNTIDSKPIIGGVIGGVALILLFIAIFFFIRRRNNRRKALNQKIYIDPSLEVVDPFLPPSSTHPTSTFPSSQNLASNGQSLPSQSSRLAERGQPFDTASMSSNMISQSDTPSSVSGGLPTLTPLRRRLSTPALNTPSASRLHLVGSQTNLLDSKAREAATEPLMQQSSPRLGGTHHDVANARVLRHEDSGVRMPPPGGDVELPPFYTPG